MSGIRRRCAAPFALVLTLLTLVPATLQAGESQAPLLQSDSLAASALSVRPHYALDRQGARLTRVRAAFPDAHGQLQQLQFTVDTESARESMHAFGFSPSEVDGLHARCRAAGDCDRARFEQELLGYYHAHQLRLRQRPGHRPRLFVDIPAVVDRDTHRVRAAADALRDLAQTQNADTEWLLQAAVALVQVGLAYRTPEAESEGRKTLGFYTPAKALATGYGDCDTKSALLAAILRQLGDWKLVGVRVPDHYLLGIAREPRAGEAYIEHAGERFVLIEAAGPAHRRPGDVADRTRVALARGEELRIDPMF